MLSGYFTDPEGDAFTLGAASQPADGTGTVAAGEGGTLQFKPGYKFAGESAFSASATDSAGATSSSNVTVKVTVLGGYPCWAAPS
jgi:hypothetical protein